MAILKNDFSILCIIGALSCLPACMDVRWVEKDQKDVNSTRSNELRAQSGSSSVLPNDEFNSYRVILRGLPGTSVSLQREIVGESKGTSSVILHLGVRHGEAVDAQVLGGNKYRYYFLNTETQERKGEDHVDILVPEDLKLSGEIYPESILGEKLFSGSPSPWGRIIFAEKTNLRTNGRDLVLKAHYIQFEQQVTIRSFAPGSEAKSQKDAVDGGRIFLSAQKAVGEVSFNLSGRKGFVGVEGSKPDPSLKGATGSSGQDALLVARGCPARQRPCLFLKECIRNATDGGVGGLGRQGYMGGPGGPGGDSAFLEVKIEEQSEFSMKVEGEPGIGGRGGLGGRGGDGGDGGPAGKIKGMGRNCRVAMKGQPGPEGERGRQGPWGPAGRRQSVYQWRDGQKLEIRRGDM